MRKDELVKLINILKLVVKICQILVKIKNTLSIIIDLSLYEIKVIKGQIISYITRRIY